MGRSRRYIKANKFYEIGFRARNTLPFVCTDYMAMIIEGILARVQRNSKVILHHYVWEGSHAHLLCTARDAEQLQQFYGQLKKQLTDAVKCLTGLKYLNLYDDRASVIELATLEDAIAKVAYVYANPSNDDLVSDIEHYPGVNSFKGYKSAKGLDARAISDHPWVRQSGIPKLKTRSVTRKQDEKICKEMLKDAEEDVHTLEVFPNKWIEAYIDSPTDAQVDEIRARCYGMLREREKENNLRRSKQGKRVIGKHRLQKQPILAKHQPQKRSRRIFVQCCVKELRLKLIKEHKDVSKLCALAYREWRRGNTAFPWPPGTFRPSMRPTANLRFPAPL